MACCQEFAVIDCHVATLLAMTMLVIRWLLATQGKRAKSLRRGGEWAEKCASRTRIQAIALFARAQNGCQGGGIYGIFCKFGRLIASGPFFSGGRLGKAEWSEDKVV